MATTNDLKNGLVLNLDGQLWSVTAFQHVKPGKGGAFVRTTLKNVLTGKVVDKTFNAGTKVDTATVDRRDMTFLYKRRRRLRVHGRRHVRPDPDPGDTVGTAAGYLLENQVAMVALHEGVPLYVELPASVELVVAHTEPGLQGDRSTGGTKPATLETGAEIQVPLFLTTGEKVKVDTRDGRYLGRVSSMIRAPAPGLGNGRWTSCSSPRRAATTRIAVLTQRRETDDAPPVSDYAAMLVEGVTAHRERIDQLLAEHAEGWTVARMPAVDRTLLRIGVFELLWVDEIDDPVAITEAVELARTLSTDDCPRFLNGVLGRISDIAEHLRAAR